MRLDNLRRTVKNLQKKEYFCRLLKADNVLIHLKTDVKQPLELPPAVKDCYTMVLCIGHHTPYPIPDLDVTDEAIIVTLTVDREPHACRIPWEAIYYMGHGGELGFGWPEDLPVSFLHHFHMKLGQGIIEADVYEDGYTPPAKKPSPFKVFSGDAPETQPQEKTETIPSFLNLVSSSTTSDE